MKSQEQMNVSPNYMTYNGNHLFHFTSFSSSIRIISSNCLIFGDFKNMNDISESRREIFDKTAIAELNKYKSLSFTLDNCGKRGFEIDSLWGYYAEKGNGVCLVFNKKKLISQFRLIDGFKRCGKIRYIKNFSNAFFPQEGDIAIQKQIEQNCNGIFFTKSKDWRNEYEYRLLIRTEFDHKTLLHFGDALVAIIICMPLENIIENSCEYKILKGITPLPILHYQTRLGDKTLTEIGGPTLWPLLGVDMHVDV